MRSTQYYARLGVSEAAPKSLKPCLQPTKVLPLQLCSDQLRLSKAQNQSVLALSLAQQLSKSHRRQQETAFRTHTQMQTAHIQIISLQHELNMEQKRAKSLQQQLVAQKRLVDKIKSQFSDQISKGRLVASLQLQNQELRDSLRQLHDTMQVLKAQQERLNNACEESTKIKLSRQIQLQSQISKKSNQYFQQLRQLSARISKLQIQNASLLITNQQLQIANKQADAQITSYVYKNRNLQNQLDKLKHQIEQLHESSRQNMDQMRNQFLKNVTEKQRKQAQLMYNINSLQKINRQLQNQLAQLRQQILRRSGQRHIKNIEIQKEKEYSLGVFLMIEVNVKPQPRKSSRPVPKALKSMNKLITITINTIPKTLQNSTCQTDIENLELKPRETSKSQNQDKFRWQIAQLNQKVRSLLKQRDALLLKQQQSAVKLQALKFQAKSLRQQAALSSQVRTQISQGASASPSPSKKILGSHKLKLQNQQLAKHVQELQQKIQSLKREGEQRQAGFGAVIAVLNQQHRKLLASRG